MLRILALTTLLLATVLVPTAAACTCDPIPALQLVRCVVGGSECPPAVEDLGLPTVQEVKDFVDENDPRDWPCACDPVPSPL